MLNELSSYFKQEEELYGSIALDIKKEDLQNLFKHDSAPQTIKPVIEKTQTFEPEPELKQPTQFISLGTLDELKVSLDGCKNCPLCENRTQVVFGSGNQNADLMIIGEAPGADEDKQGYPFVGKAGQLLTKMLQAIHINRDDVYIANIVKCRPQNNRDPLPEEMEACIPFLKQQIEKVSPKIILSLGRISGQTLTSTQQSLSSLRGRSYSYENKELIVTYHPAALLRNPKWKRLTWEDLKNLKLRLDKLQTN